MGIEIFFIVGLLLVGLYGVVRPESGRMWGSVRETGSGKAALAEQKRRSRTINRILSIFLLVFSLLLLLAVL